MIRKVVPQEINSEKLVKLDSERNIEINGYREIIKAFEESSSSWRSIWICNIISFLCGIQFAIYFTSMWPYLSSLDRNVSLEFLGIIMAVYSVGQLVASPLFGYWSQKAITIKHPAACGLFLTAIGNLIYALLPVINKQAKWCMLVSRLLVGFGSGNLGVLRAYVATASAPKDRKKAITLGIAVYVIGQSVAPGIQGAFSPIGSNGYHFGKIVLNMHTIPAFLMIIIALIAILILYIFFEENYAGIIRRDNKKDPYAVLPKSDLLAVVVLIYMWFVQQGIVTTIEAMAAPLTISMYNWKDATAILYNGIIQSASCILSVINYLLIAYTKIGKIPNRKLIIFSCVIFILYYTINMPWPFYSAPLDYIKLASNSSVENLSYSGGCYRKYKWCAYTSRTPLSIYVATLVIGLGFAFPYYTAPTSALFSQVLGPRHQEFMQGIYVFFGSLSRTIVPLYTTKLFENYGHMYPNLVQLVLLVIALLLMLIFYRRLVPLKIVPELGVPTRYKHGIFYRL